MDLAVGKGEPQHQCLNAKDFLHVLNDRDGASLTDENGFLAEGCPQCGLPCFAVFRVGIGVEGFAVMTHLDLDGDTLGSVLF